MSAHPAFTDEELVQVAAAPNKRKKVLKEDLRGCEHCPMNEIHGIQKIKGRIRGKGILLFAQSPGPQENKEGIELIGPAGEWFWAEAERAGLFREDLDVQNAMRCLPADWVTGSYNSYLKMRNPSKQELHCCSIYTERALEKSQARQIIILGAIAAKEVLKTRSLPNQKCFWSDKLQARVYLLDHPAFFVRGYGQGARLDAFRKTLARVVVDRDTGAGEEIEDQFAELRKQDYRLVVTAEQAESAKKIIRKYAARGRRISFDIEWDEFEDGHHIFTCGFSPKPGLSFVFVWRHQDVAVRSGAAVLAAAKELLEDGTIRKAAHNGCSDCNALREYEGIEVAGYDFDTLLSEFLHMSDKFSYGLSAVAERRYPKFSGYGLIIVPEMMAAAKKQWIKEHPDDKKIPKIYDSPVAAQETWLYGGGEGKKALHFRHISLETMRLYNGADCDLAKRIEVANKKHVPDALMGLYVDLSFLLVEMEKQGPFYDFEQHQKLIYLYPKITAELRRKCRRMVRRHRGAWEDLDLDAATQEIYRYRQQHFNPGSPEQVMWALYQHFGMEFPSMGKRVKPNSQKGTMMLLALQHKFPQAVLDYRAAKKVVGTLEGYERSAKAYEGRLRTKWWSVGARTGRLSSGGEKKKKDSTIVNLQNVKKDEQIKDLLVADVRWKQFYDAAEKIVWEWGRPLAEYWDVCAEEAQRAKKEDRKPEYPEKSLKVQSSQAEVERRLEAWVRQSMPDLKTYLMFDYGQVEIRVLAQLSDDKHLMDDCSSSDIHTKVGTVLTGWDAERIKNDEQTRTLTKNVHFGVVYSRGAVDGVYNFVLARSPADMRGRITRETIAEAIEKYFGRYAGVKVWVDEQVEFAREHGYVETMFGMTRRLNITERKDEEDEQEDFGEEGSEGKSWENISVNTPVQGSAHQLLICGLVNLRRRPKRYRILGIPPMEVHDALYFVTEVLRLPAAFTKGKFLLEKESLNTVASDFPKIKWKVPIVTDAKAGIRLGAIVKMDEKTTVGSFLLDWFKVCKRQIEALDAKMEGTLAK